MISPAGQKIIQIDITNACPHSCANCTRFVGHHRKPFFMPVEQVKNALASLEGYKGMIGIMGGEPTLHPDFKEIVGLLPKKAKPDTGLIKDFVDYRNKNLSGLGHKYGLWTSLGAGYYNNFEIIQDTFAYQCINDHSHSGKHISLLMTYKELGFSRADFIKYRDACWVQREWSASVTPKGAYFCEVAGALDMLLGWNKGWKVEPGWWKRTPDQFLSQLSFCEICSACLPVPKDVAKSGVDTVSPLWADKLKLLESRKKIKVFDTASYKSEDYKANKSCEPYLPEEGNVKRIASTNYTIKPKRIDAFVVCVNYSDYLEQTLKYNKEQVDAFHVITDGKDAATRALCNSLGVDCIISDRLHENKAPFAKGKALNDGFKKVKPSDWVLVIDADIVLGSLFGGLIKTSVLNPGVLYYTRRWGPERVCQVPEFLDALSRSYDWKYLQNKYACKRQAKVEGRVSNDIEHLPFGYFQLFNARASALRSGYNWYPENSNTAEHDDKIFGFDLFSKNKIQSLPVPEFDVIHLPHGMYKENWKGRVSLDLQTITAKVKKGEVFAIMFKCINKCQYHGKIYNVGELLETQATDVPPHFERVWL